MGAWFGLGTASAGPWADLGDAQLRSDIEVLAAAGAIDNITMQWPLPWSGILYRLEQSDAADNQPDYVLDAAMRMRARGMAETRTERLRESVTSDVASRPNVIRGFDALGRQSAQVQATVEYLWSTTAIHLQIGAQTSDKFDHQVLVPDGSYIAQRIGNAVVYAGYMPHWWGPGWMSALSLSNNARPVPQIGISRLDTRPFESSWLRWIGPWQLEFFLGVLDGPRIARNTIYDGLRFAFSPLPHLEIGLSRTDMMCGTGHACKPFAGYFDFSNQSNHVNIVNDEATIDIRYSGAFRGWSYEVYAQAMNEDTNPIVHSGTSHLFGASVWLPISAGLTRLTIEYADSLATRDIWGGEVFHGFSYNNYDYLDGMRYRGRTLGFSLDSDSRLLSLQLNYTNSRADSFTLTYHRADISDPQNLAGNVVTTAPVLLNMLEARADTGFRLQNQAVRLSVVGRLQDDQPRPDRGFLAAIETSLTVDF